MTPKTSKRATPNQNRSQKTMERVLNAAAELLEEVGFEGLSTNMICKRAGLTPPALYRYFPNKYAVLKELGERLMEAQNALLNDWNPEVEPLAPQIEHFLRETLLVTRTFKAGGWIMRSLHATPVLSNVRVESHRRMATLMTEKTVEYRPNLDRNQVFASARVSVELGYALIEMLFDEPTIDEDAALRMTAEILADHQRRLLRA
ncbi:MAG: TetR/AcrR family transcriptional regulator [Alphaproteobacteria bacterium]|nr:TetR/AcrR family transcriptional regulator [Alphaproteobacteria bacterium]